jgi:hypothetical protein
MLGVLQGQMNALSEPEDAPDDRDLFLLHCRVRIRSIANRDYQLL